MRTHSKIAVILLFLSGLAFQANVWAKKVSPETVAGATTIDLEKAKELFKQGITFIDVRSDRDWEAGRIPGAIHIELHHKFTEAALAAVVGKNDPVVFYCNSVGCMRSSEASEMAVSWGWTKVYYYRLGYPDWKSSGMAIE